MVKLYEVLKNYPLLSRRLFCKGLMFTNYECPQVVRKANFYTECNFIVYVVSGKRTFIKNGRSWVLSEGVCAFVKKGTHVSEKEAGDEWCVMCFFMPDNFLKQFVRENRSGLPHVAGSQLSSQHVLLLQVNDLSRAFFFSMLPYFHQTPPPPENLVELKFRELILSLLMQKENNHLLAYLFQLANEHSPSVEEIMQNNFTSNLTLADYAKLCCKSTATFKREFKRIYREPPAKWVKKQRLTLSIDLLQHTGRSIADIAFDCGFENQTHFSRVFKQHTGISPLQFRKKSGQLVNIEALRTP